MSKKRQGLVFGYGRMLCSYEVTSDNVAGNKQLRYAQPRFGKMESVVLKFYHEQDAFDSSLQAHSKLRESDHVCPFVTNSPTTPDSSRHL